MGPEQYSLALGRMADGLDESMDALILGMARELTTAAGATKEWRRMLESPLLLYSGLKAIGRRAPWSLVASGECAMGR
eukprot:COSAG02_NODE_6697_length_3415_cov_2.543727_6_plen_78_part_00